MTLASVLLVAATFAAAAIDVRRRRIPNALTGTLAFAGIALHVPQGLVPTLAAIAAMLIVFLAGSFAFSAGWFGGGDVKLIAACCGLVGYPGSVALVLEILLAGAFLSLITAALRGHLFELIHSTLNIVRYGSTAQKSGALPYGVAIAAGSLTYALSFFVPLLRMPV